MDSATTALEEGQLHRDDDEQMSYAVDQHKTLVTHNRADFETMALSYFAEGKVHFGIIIAVRRPPHEIVRRLLIVINQVTADEMQNQVRYI